MCASFLHYRIKITPWPPCPQNVICSTWYASKHLMFYICSVYVVWNTLYLSANHTAHQIVSESAPSSMKCFSLSQEKPRNSYAIISKLTCCQICHEKSSSVFSFQRLLQMQLRNGDVVYLWGIRISLFHTPSLFFFFLSVLIDNSRHLLTWQMDRTANPN